MRTRIMIMPFLLVGLLVPGAAAAAQRTWQVVELPPVAGDWASFANDVDEQGNAVGYSSETGSLDAHRAVRWDRDGRAVDLGTIGGARASATAIGPRGVVVGRSETAAGQWHATRWDRRGATDLGTLPGGTDSDATAIGADGTIGGNSGTADPNLRLAVRWDRDNRATALDAVPGSTRHWVVGVNDTGIVYGGAYSADTGTRAVVWSTAGRATVLTSLGGSNDTITDVNRYGVATGQSNGRPARWTRDGAVTELPTLGGPSGWAGSIADNGTVVGRADAADLITRHAAKWDQQGRMTDLGVLPGTLYSIALDHNRTGTTVGYGGEGSASFALVWDSGTGPTTLPNLPGTSDSRATTITNSGHILGNAAVTSGVPRAVLWR
ncbi:hypothetical protein [Actinokineospora diospyrosa]|uniref:Extracellular repeat, HAF family n=1 Tax=Actinokineospora diospyrosa TaxID=103728 RepID=A0ABT1IF09_9PSEU|nr:hypothetical protein [Actinokineospora diospyrosa]MCP2271131.1 putative extracellular repeat, HAF family [Actinokineospora diospyrosa]